MSLVRVYPIHERACTVQLEKPIGLDTFQAIKAIQLTISKKYKKEISDKSKIVDLHSTILRATEFLARCYLAP
jgi:hypothetical protein